MISTTTLEAKKFTTDTIVPLVNAFSTLQNPDGCVVSNFNEASMILNRLREPVRTVYSMIEAPSSCAAAFEADIDLWLSRGLDSPPQFDHSLAAYIPPAPGMSTFFIAPLIATNGPSPKGAFLECFLAYREEPTVLGQITKKMPHPSPQNACKSCRLLTGSRRLLTGNCIVFFPENVAVAKKVESQAFSLFFLNKFQRILISETLLRAKQVFGDRIWASEQLSAEDCYSARAIWCYVHDYFHQCGPRPLDANLQVKMNFFVGLLEETKVDCQAAVTAFNGEVPFGREVFEFILLERLLRYPNQPDATKNFDAGSGLFLFGWLLQDGRGLRASANRLSIDLDGCAAAMAELAESIESIETTKDNAEYRYLAKNFVRRILPEGIDGERFAVPNAYIHLVRAKIPDIPMLSFFDLPY